MLRRLRNTKQQVGKWQMNQEMFGKSKIKDYIKNTFKDTMLLAPLNQTPWVWTPVAIGQNTSELFLFAPCQINKGVFNQKGRVPW